MGVYAEHTQMRGLSGGQKVKVVIAAAMWNNPHILVLDEPTNYLDRDSLAALAVAIHEFGGGVVVISHNCEFAENVCPEKWRVYDFKNHVEGQDWGGKGESRRSNGCSPLSRSTPSAMSPRSRTPRRSSRARSRSRRSAAARPRSLPVSRCRVTTKMICRHPAFHTFENV